MSDQTFLVGTGSKIIYACRLTADGQLQVLLENNSGKGPSWLLAHNDLLYATNEEEDKIETFTIDDRTKGKLTSKGQVSSKGSTPCSLALDPTGKWLAIANYGGNGSASFAVLSLDQFNQPVEIGAQVVTIEGHGPNADRQDRSHCHQVQFHQNQLYGVDLGTDTISVYQFHDTTGEIRLLGGRIQTPPGAGPRHLLFHPDKPLAFLCNEVDSTMCVYRVDAAAQKFELQQIISTRRQEDLQHSTKENTAAELHFSPDKKYLVVSNRGDENLVVYNLNTSDEQPLSVKEYVDIRGAGPRFFTFDPTGKFLLVANQHSNNLICFSYKKDKGTLEFVSQLANIQTPEHILFIS